MRIVHLGGANTVTGSCHLLRANGVNMLVDCGLAQGADYVAPMDSWPVSPGKIDFVFLTHAHIDHIGPVPGPQITQIARIVEQREGRTNI